MNDNNLSSADSPPNSPMIVDLDAVSSPARPRIWTAFVVLLIELLVMVGVQALFVSALLYSGMGDGKTFQQVAADVPARLLRPSMYVLMIVVSQLSTGAIIWFFANRSAKRTGVTLTNRLGLRWPSMSPWKLAVLMIGSIPVLLTSIGAVWLLEQVLPGDESRLQIYKNMTNGWAIVFIVAVGLFPGIFEELAFRGFFQRRMLQRFSPTVAIGITSLVFGLFHVTPHGILLATILGVWLGVMAWRTNSIWPGALCHAFINSGWNVYQVGRFHWGFPTIPSTAFCIGFGALVLAAFAWAIYLLKEHRPGEVASV